MPSITQEYLDPATNTYKTVTVSFELKNIRMQTDSTAPVGFAITGSVSGGTDILIDVDKIVQDAIDGKASSTQDTKTEAYTNGAVHAGDTIIPLDSVTGFVVGDVICIKSSYTATDQDYAIITAVSSANKQITVSTDGSGTGVASAYKKYAIVQDLTGENWGASTGNGGILGVRAQKERPSAPTNVRALQKNTGDGTRSLDVTWTESSSHTDVVKYYDVYVHRKKLTNIPENYIPVYADFAYSGSCINIKQYADDDNGLYNLGASKLYQIYVVAKSDVGQRDVKESTGAHGEQKSPA